MSVFVHAGGWVKNDKNCTLLSNHLPRFWLHNCRYGKGSSINYVGFIGVGEWGSKIADFT